MEYLPVELVEQIIVPVGWDASRVCKLWNQICVGKLFYDCRAREYDRYLIYFILTNNIDMIKKLLPLANFNCYDNFPICCAYYTGNREIIKLFGEPLHCSRSTCKLVEWIEPILHYKPKNIKRLSQSYSIITDEILERNWKLYRPHRFVLEICGKNKWQALNWVLDKKFVPGTEKNVMAKLTTKAAMIGKHYDLMDPSQKFDIIDLKYIGDNPKLIEKIFGVHGCIGKLFSDAILYGYNKTVKLLLQYINKNTKIHFELPYQVNTKVIKILYRHGSIKDQDFAQMLEQLIRDGRLTMFKFALVKALNIDNDYRFILRQLYYAGLPNMLKYTMKQVYFQRIQIGYELFADIEHSIEEDLVLINLLLKNTSLFKQECKNCKFVDDLVDSLELTDRSDLLSIAATNNLYNLARVLVKQKVVITTKVRLAARLANRKVRKLLD